jgi:hypothetical protein
VIVVSAFVSAFVVVFVAFNIFWRCSGREEDARDKEHDRRKEILELEHKLKSQTTSKSSQEIQAIVASTSTGDSRIGQIEIRDGRVKFATRKEKED